MAKLTSFNNPKSKKERWLASNIDANMHKIKNLKFVCRGGQRSWISSPLNRPYNNESDSKMNVDECNQNYTSQYMTEEHKKDTSRINNKSSQDSTHGQVLKHCIVNPHQDQEDALSHLTLLQEVQRKRKYNEITDEQDPQLNNTQPMTQLSRRQKLLGVVYQNNEIPGKTAADDFKFGESRNGHPDQIYSKSYQNEEAATQPVISNKRVKLSEMENNSEVHQLVNLASGRQARKEFQRLFMRPQ